MTAGACASVAALACLAIPKRVRSDTPSRRRDQRAYSDSSRS